MIETKGADMSDRPDLVWGIRDRAGVGALTNQFALIVGIVSVALGLIGFLVTGFTPFIRNTDEALLGLIALNPFHNVVLIGIGALLLLAAFALTPSAAGGAVFAVGGFLVVAAVLAFLGALDDLLSVEPGDVVNILLYLVLGALCAIVGLIGGLRGS